MKAFPKYKRKTKVFHFLRVSLLPYNSQTLSCTAEIDISLKSSQNGGWHRLGCYPTRSSFHRWKRGKRDIWSFICSAFHVFSGGKWNGLDSNLAFVIRRSESFPGIYRPPLYMKAFARNKWTPRCSIIHVFRRYLITRKRFHVQRSSIYLREALGMAGDMD